MSRFREDDRFKAVGPDSIVLAYPTLPLSTTTNSNNRDEAEIWFDWAFVDFWKSNFCKIQLDSWLLSSSQPPRQTLFNVDFRLNLISRLCLLQASFLPFTSHSWLMSRE